MQIGRALVTGASAGLGRALAEDARTEFHDRDDRAVLGLPEALWMDARDVARAGVDGLLHDRAVVVPGRANAVAPSLSQVLPSGLTRRAARLVTPAGGSRG